MMQNGSRVSVETGRNNGLGRSASSVKKHAYAYVLYHSFFFLGGGGRYSQQIYRLMNPALFFH